MTLSGISGQSLAEKCVSLVLLTLLAVFVVLLTSSIDSYASDFDYKLTATEVKPDVYVVGGVAGDLTFKNGGNICLLYTSPSPRD